MEAASCSISFGLRRCLALVLVAAALAAAGCANKWVSVRKQPTNPLSAQLNLLSWSGPQPSERTTQLLRRYDLAGAQEGDSQELLAKLNQFMEADPTAETVYAMSELAYLHGTKKEGSDQKAALDLYGAAVVYAYAYLFDRQYSQTRNPYDPQYRGACDLYNTALESALRIVQKQGVLTPGGAHTIVTARNKVDITVVTRGALWHNDDFERFEFVSDYQLAGLTNHYRTHGLGVPLIAVRKQRPDSSPAERYIPPKLSFPVTAFMRVEHEKPNAAAPLGRVKAVIELYDPLITPDITVAGRTTPLESDVSTPLAYFLNQPELDEAKLSTAGLLTPDKAQSMAGMYMLEPYQPGKIPVIMVHGLWSTPVTWMEMFNDLRSDPRLRARYQFWFYMYPTGKPFWFSAAKMRQDLAELRVTLDPQRQQPALDQIVLVGHSMGGLVSKLQAVDSGDEFWRIVSDQPFEVVKASPEVRQGIERTLFFEHNPSVRRVVTIGTPHRGSEVANDTTRWLFRKAITLPDILVAGRQQLITDNPGVFREDSLLSIDTSIDSLAPDSPFLPVLLKTPPAPGVKMHNIIGQVPGNSFLRRVSGTSDGVVKVDSARLDQAVSEIIVAADHSAVHRHPRSILEVRRILIEQLDDVDSHRYGPPPVVQTSATQFTH